MQLSAIIDLSTKYQENRYIKMSDISTIQNAALEVGIISAMSKTFLVGEYCVVFGGDAVILVTPPKFKLIVSVGMSALISVDARSPAFLFYEKHMSVFQNMLIEFIDPHNKSGGFGASSAQFIMLYKLYLKITQQQFDISVFLNEYRHITGKNTVIKPSGVDCLAQHENQHIYFDGSKQFLKTMQWNFADIDFCVLKTGLKIKTHEHLSSINNIDPDVLKMLNSYVKNVRNSFINRDSDLLCSNIQMFYQLLDTYGLVTEQTQHLTKNFLKIDGVLAVKGCGAMLADTILIIYEISKKQNVMNAIKEFPHLESDIYENKR